MGSWNSLSDNVLCFLNIATYQSCISVHVKSAIEVQWLQYLMPDHYTHHASQHV